MSSIIVLGYNGIHLPQSVHTRDTQENQYNPDAKNT